MKKPQSMIPLAGQAPAESLEATAAAIAIERPVFPVRLPDKRPLVKWASHARERPR